MDQHSTTKDIKCVALNCHGFKGKTVYINDRNRQYDCIFLSETWLLESEKHLTHNFKIDFELFFTPAKVEHAGQPYGGNIMLFKRTIGHKKLELILCNDFTTIVRLNTDLSSILVSGVYLQSISNKPNYINIYQNQLGTISGTLLKFEQTYEYIILGDFQCCPSSPLHHTSNRIGKPNHLT